MGIVYSMQKLTVTFKYHLEVIHTKAQLWLLVMKNLYHACAKRQQWQ